MSTHMEIEDLASELGIDFFDDEPETKEAKRAYKKKEVHDISERVLDSRQIKIKRNDDLHFIKLNALSQLCPLPKKGEQYRIITEKQFNAYALMLGLLENNIIDEMYMAIYRINEPTVNSICEFIKNGKIKKSTFIISTFFKQTKKPEQWAQLLRDFCDENSDTCNHVYIHTHAKVFCARVKDDYYVFEVSGNMSDNAKIEQYLYENNKQVFDFHKDWMLSLREI